MNDTALLALVVIPLIASVLSIPFKKWNSQIGITSGGLQAVALYFLYQSTSGQWPIRYPLAGWGTPLGIELHVDGLSLIMLSLSTLVGFGIALYASPYFKCLYRHDSETKDQYFWPIFLLTSAALNTIFMSGDLFNYYVALELLTLSAVGLVALSGKKEGIRAALHYLFTAMVSSMLFLLGVTMIYGHYGVLDWSALSQLIKMDTPTLMAVVLITIALLIKTALVPFHFWLPSAHSIAPAPVSALLSGVVLKASFFIMYRLWFTILPEFDPIEAVKATLAGLGGIAIIWGSLQALRQNRVKLMLAYSSVAQIGYLFTFFVLNQNAQTEFGIAYFILSHGFAKSAAFLAVGALMISCGSDELSHWQGLARKEPALILALGLASVSLIGLPPSGGFIAKFVLLSATIEEGYIALTLAILISGLFSAAYVFKIIGTVMQTNSNHACGLPSQLPFQLRWVPLGLASIAIVLSFTPTYIFSLLQG